MGAPRWQPSPADLEIIRSHNDRSAAKLLGLNDSTVRKVRREHGLPNPATAYDKRAQEDEPQEASDGPERGGRDTSGVWNIPAHVSFQNGMWAALETVQQEMDALDTEVFEADITLPDEQPVLVTYVADTHIGHTAARLDWLRRDFERVRNTPGVYAILGGDLTDNVVTSVSSRGSYHEQLTPLRIQRALIDDALRYVGAENILALILGNHDAWQIRDTDADPIAYLASKLARPYLGPFGFLNLTLGTERYRILAAHQFRMRSSFHPLHQAKRLDEFVGSGDPEIIFTGHTHEPGAESGYRRGSHKFYGQAGSYMSSSRYSKSLGFGTVSADMPGAVIFPNQHKVMGVRDAFEDGIHLLASYRSDVVCPCRHCAAQARPAPARRAKSRNG